MKLLVIGTGGYLGGYIMRYASPAFRLVGVSSRLSTDAIHLDLNCANDFNYNIVDADTVVLFTAAISAPDICAHEHDRAWAVNVSGTSAFIENVIARGGRVVFFSSDTVYGERTSGFDESAECAPAGEYAVMKWEVERRFAGSPSFKVIRLSYVFSREDKFTHYISECAQRNEEAELFHPFFRAIVHRDDVACGALSLAERWYEIPEQIINFGGPQIVSRVDFVEALRVGHFHGLRYNVVEPQADFFRNRPRVIAMTSPVFAKLLGRPPRKLSEAVRLEFGI